MPWGTVLNEKQAGCTLGCTEMSVKLHTDDDSPNLHEKGNMQFYNCMLSATALLLLKMQLKMFLHV